MPISTGPYSRLPYDSASFVDRELQIESVRVLAKQLSEGKTLPLRTIVFLGHKGSGRTWLLKRLHEELPRLLGVRSVYLDLTEWDTADDPPESGIHGIVRGIVDAVSAQASDWLGNASSPTKGRIPGGTGTRLPAAVDELLGQYVLVCLLDHVYETSPGILKVLEKEFLQLLATRPRVLIVMAGRGETYPWKSPPLRLYTEEILLEPFNDLAFTTEQLEKQQPTALSRVTEIHELSGGYPLGNYYLATTPDVDDAVRETINALLDGVAFDMRVWLEALCVLNAFDEERIPALWATYAADASIRDKPYKEIRRVRDALLNANLARWNQDLGGWEMDAAVRRVLQKYLQRTQPAKWRMLHCAAFDLYDQWRQQYPQQRIRWQTEADYHAQCLRDAGHDSQQCPKSEKEK